MSKRFMAGAALGLAQALTWAEPTSAQQLLSLSATARAEVVQDRATLTLFVQREGRDPVQVQQQLNQVLAPALQQARSEAGAELEVATGNFNVSPRYGNEGQMRGWTGRAELQLAGRDIGRLSSLAARLPGLALADVQWSVSPALRERTQDELQAKAVERFRQRAQALAKQFGQAGYQLQSVKVSGDEERPGPRPMMARAAAPMADAPVALEAGLGSVSVTVSGTVQLRP